MGRLPADVSTGQFRHLRNAWAPEAVRPEWDRLPGPADPAARFICAF